MRLIDADALKDNIKRTNKYFDLKFYIDEAPTICSKQVIFNTMFTTPRELTEHEYKTSLLQSILEEFHNDIENSIIIEKYYDVRSCRYVYCGKLVLGKEQEI